LECTEGGSSKFWEGSVDGKSLTVRFGKSGTAGQTKVKKLASATAAQAELARLIREKRAKGYVDAPTGTRGAADDKPPATAKRKSEPARAGDDALEAVKAKAPKATSSAPLTKQQAARLAGGYHDTPYAISADGSHMLVRRKTDGVVCHLDVATGELAELIDDASGPLGCAFTSEGNAVVWTKNNAYLCRSNGDKFNQFTLGVGGECSVVLGGRAIVFRRRYDEWKTVVLAIRDTALYFVAGMRIDLGGVFDREGRVFSKNGRELINVEPAIARALTRKRQRPFTESDLLDDESITELAEEAE
jgi:predicted DNA-binding WGR domain protein